MSRSLYTKSTQLLSPSLRNFCDLRFLHCTSVIITRSFSSDNHTTKETSFTVSYLINSCGLSPEAAHSASKKVKFQTLGRPDSVLSLLNKHGFSKSQISKIIKLKPRILLSNTEKTIALKLNFFSSVGITGPNLAKLISSNPLVLYCSLSNRIIPVYKFLMSALQFDNDMVIKAVCGPSRIFIKNVEKVCARNLLVLREIGMPQSIIQALLMYHTSLLCCNVDKLRDKIKRLIDMGLCPTKTKFIHALHAMVSFSESNWQHKLEVYERCGWSKDEILSAFKKYPQYMTFSEKKMIGTIDFLVNVMDMKPSEIAACPYLFTYSLKKRIIPRGLVIKILMLKCVLDKNISFYTVLLLTDKCFLEKYVDEHRKHIPYLQDVFEGRMCPQELGFQYGHH
ncbi:hypothetical protein JCGZ_20861 [Jatropha curcas]|uniref:Uncharacterized protein n=1 Tax=Jatropha curcas TaxID=180498 RepID=A0A067L5W2_JATCU|nr:hypothetical protein JCGZ_20861 [Jatropha curcas]